MVSPAPPYVDGANTTPAEMTMSFLLPKYVQFGTKEIDRQLTAHAQRAYWTFHFDRGQADAAGLSDKRFVDLIKYVQSWGFFTSCWLCGSGDDRSRGWASIGGRITTFVRELLSRPAPDQFIPLIGEELNNGCPPGPEGADSIIRGVCGLFNPMGIKPWIHLTSNYDSYPMNVPPDQFDAARVAWVQQWGGMVEGLAWQSDPFRPASTQTPAIASAGYQGAKLWDARRTWAHALGADGLVAAFEVEAEAQLEGKCTEEQGCLRSLELVSCTSDGTVPTAVAGTMGGIRQPDGSPL